MSNATEPELRAKSDTVPQSESDTAHVIAPPPLLFCGAMALALAVHVARPISWLPRGLAWWLGVLLILTAIPIGVSALRALAHASTPLNPRRPTTAIATGGAFRLSRNPIYLFMLLLFVGIASLLNSLWVVLSALMFAAVLQRGVVEREVS